MKEARRAVTEFCIVEGDSTREIHRAKIGQFSESCGRKVSALVERDFREDSVLDKCCVAEVDRTLIENRAEKVGVPLECCADEVRVTPPKSCVWKIGVTFEFCALKVGGVQEIRIVEFSNVTKIGVRKGHPLMEYRPPKSALPGNTKPLKSIPSNLS